MPLEYCAISRDLPSAETRAAAGLRVGGGGIRFGLRVAGAVAAGRRGGVVRLQANLERGKPMKRILTIAVGLALSAPAFAQTADFETVDADGSGAVSFAEAAEVMPELTDEMFATADLDGTGELTPEQWQLLNGG